MGCVGSFGPLLTILLRSDQPEEGVSKRTIYLDHISKLESRWRLRNIRPRIVGLEQTASLQNEAGTRCWPKEFQSASFRFYKQRGIAKELRGAPEGRSICGDGQNAIVSGSDREQLIIARDGELYAAPVSKVPSPGDTSIAAKSDD